ncbi:hypothetical protein KSP39_PZI003606 [Platanthera zijinensis]|uniref:Retrovirus-related Pol polyprotein from transposon TNT 1-94-like beta-barrel domain-containing protein n=1 Tax=Platanthera zijinensis TaxID=2320716 RepID=A0AAP0BV97_9ASPA
MEENQVLAVDDRIAAAEHGGPVVAGAQKLKGINIKVFAGGWRQKLKSEKDISGGSVILGDATSTQILRRGRVDLRLTSGKTLALHDVLYAPRVRKNLVSDSVLVKKDYSLVYPGFPDVLEGYSDANWVTDSLDVKSMIGYVFLLGGAAIS